MGVMSTKRELEHNVALLKKLLELEHNRLISERDRVNELQADSERKDQIIESLKLSHEEKKSTNSDWHIISKHFNDLLDEENIPHKNVKHSGKKRIRREANDRATLENKNIKKYSDVELGRELKFPQKVVSRSFAREPKKK